MDRKRYSIIDIIRGITIISMILYHGMWDVVYIHNVDVRWYNSIIGRIWQQSIAWSFVIISGFCFSFGKAKLKNGLKMIIGSAIISIVTLVFMPNQRIIFGVLTMLGSCTIIVCLIERVLGKCRDIIGIVLGLIMFILTLNISNGYIGIKGLLVIRLPRSLYNNWVSTYLGFPFKNFWSMDYYGVVPWIFLFIVGFYLHKLFVRKNILHILDKVHNKALEQVGKHSLIIYMVHQPIVYVILALVSNFLF